MIHLRPDWEMQGDVETVSGNAGAAYHTQVWGYSSQTVETVADDFILEARASARRQPLGGPTEVNYSGNVPLPPPFHSDHTCRAKREDLPRRLDQIEALRARLCQRET